MRSEVKRLREQAEVGNETLQERNKEIFDLTQRLKKFTSQFKIIEQMNNECQTDISFKNDHFTQTID